MDFSSKKFISNIKKIKLRLKKCFETEFKTDLSWQISVSNIYPSQMDLNVANLSLIIEVLKIKLIKKIGIKIQSETKFSSQNPSLISSIPNSNQRRICNMLGTKLEIEIIPSLISVFDFMFFFVMNGGDKFFFLISYKYLINQK